MNNLRSEFEKWYEENNDFMINTQFMLEGDRYLDRHVRMSWLAWVEQQKKIDEKQKYIDHLHSLMDEAVLHMQGGSYAEALELLK